MFPGLRGYKKEEINSFPGPYNPKSIPIDVSQSTLFDTMYVHPMIRDGMFVWNHYQLVALDGAWVAAGTREGFDQYIGELPKEKRHTSKSKLSFSPPFSS